MANDGVYNRVRKMSFRSANKKHLRSQHCMKSETGLCDRRSTIAYPPSSVKTRPLLTRRVRAAAATNKTVTYMHSKKQT